MKDEPDLSKMRVYSPAELRERRAGKRRPKPPRRKVTKTRIKRGPLRRTVVASVSITPELKLRAQRDLGGGSFSKAVNDALKFYLKHLENKNDSKKKA